MNSRRSTVRLAVAALAAVAAPSIAVLALAPRAASAQTDATPGYRPKSDPFPEGLLFRIAGKGIPDSFAFGTPFVAAPDLDVVPPEALAALRQARTFASPSNFAALTATRSFELALYRDGTTLKALLGVEGFAAVRARLAERGIDDGTAERMKPWAAWLAIVATTADTNDAVTRALAAQAQRARMKPLQLEFAQDQVRALETIPREAQLALLVHAAAHRDGYAELVPPIAEAWKTRSLPAVFDAIDRFPRRYPEVAGEYRQVVRSVVGNRIVQMKHRLTLPLRQGRVFIAVDALLLQGSGGLLAALARDGYRIEKLW